MNAHLLHVEDDPNDVFLFDFAFRQAQIRMPIRVATNGREAIASLSEAAGPDPCKPCLVLLDLNLPDTSGFEVLAWIRGRPELAQLPVVIFTSSSHPADQKRAMELGADDYLVKPVDMSRMDDVIKDLNRRWLRTACQEKRVLVP